MSLPKKQLIGGAAYLGLAHNPFTPDSDPSGDEFEVRNLSLISEMTTLRQDDRRSLRASLDRFGERLKQQDDFKLSFSWDRLPARLP